MSKRESSKPYSVEVQKGSIRMDAQYTEQFRREPEHTMRDMEHLKMHEDKMTMTLHVPKQ